MRAGLRLVVMAFVAGLSLAPLPLHAQEAAQEPSAPPAEAIGPRELRDFNLQGTVTRPAEAASTPPAPESAPAARAGAPPGETAISRPPERRAEAAETRPSGAQPRRETAVASRAALPPILPEAAPSVRPSRSSITVNLPPARAASAPVEFPDEDPSAAAALAPEQGASLWPWLLAAVALGAGGAFLFWRRSGREAFAGGPQASAFVAPTPQPPREPSQPRLAGPAPPVAPPPPVAAPPAPVGIVATRLRSWLDVEFEPDRCIVEEERVIFEFELDVLNSGSVSATDVRVAIQLFNASPTQDEELAAFFAGAGEDANRAPDIAPYKRFELKPQLVVPRDKLRVLEAGGRQFFVPLIGINIRYRSGKTEGQSAAGFLLGRETGGDKLAPFRVDLGARIYRGLGTRILPGNIRL